MSHPVNLFWHHGCKRTRRENSLFIVNVIKKKCNNFLLLESGIEVVLHGVIDDKSKCEYKGADWNFVKTKHVHTVSLLAKIYISVVY